MLNRRDFIKISLAGAIGASCPSLLQGRHNYHQKQNGINLCTWEPDGFYQMDDIVNHVSHFADTVSVVATYYVTGINPRGILQHPKITPSDDSLVYIIDKLHALDLDVQLKPHIDILKPTKNWRGQINPTRRFMHDYLEFITEKAQLAENTGCEQFCIGTELDATIEKRREWNRIISSVSGVFRGKITYAANHNTEELVLFWDHPRIDYIGSDFYYPAEGELALENIKNQLFIPAKKLEGLHKIYGKKIILTEFGLMPLKGANAQPFNYDYSREILPLEQELRFKAIFDLFWNKPWFAGGHAWAYWRPVETLPERRDKDFNIYQKDAERILIEKYLSSS